MEHTSEPKILREDLIRYAADRTIAEQLAAIVPDDFRANDWGSASRDAMQDGEELLADAHRLVACWNVCRGAPLGWLRAQYDPDMEALFGPSRPLHERIQDAMQDAEKAKQERDQLKAVNAELLALAQRVAGLNRDTGEIGAGMLAQLVDQARSAIAKATGA